MNLIVHPPYLVKRIFRNFVFTIPTKEKTIYLTFDDGPIPEITPWTLQTLKNYNAKATFFCVGDNVKKYPELFNQILSEKHSVGNHTYRHLNGRKTGNFSYFKDIAMADKFIPTNLFRPPYGRATRFQMKCLRESGMKIIMWTVLSGDFDTSINPEKCFRNVAGNLKPGTIITFHDSRKAEPRLRYALPEVLKKMAFEGLEGRVL